MLELRLKMFKVNSSMLSSGYSNLMNSVNVSNDPTEWSLEDYNRQVLRSGINLTWHHVNIFQYCYYIFTINLQKWVRVYIFKYSQPLISLYKLNVPFMSDLQ